MISLPAPLPPAPTTAPIATTLSTIRTPMMMAASSRKAAARSLASPNRTRRSTPSGVTSSRSKRVSGAPWKAGVQASGGLAMGRDAPRRARNVEIGDPDHPRRRGYGVADPGGLDDLAADAFEDAGAEQHHQHPAHQHRRLPP